MQRRAELLAWGTHSAPREQLARVVQALARGELVGLPTETVYGIAARADDAGALAKLAQLKGRDARQPLTWHVAGAAALERLQRVSPMVQRLVARYWPGPLTLVVPGAPRELVAIARDGWIGVRQPAHAATASLLAALDFPVVASSANPHGETPFKTAAQVHEVFGEQLAFVIDGGAPRLGESSVVLKLGPGHFEILRAGILDLAPLRAAAGLKIGFVCTGNTCRSPMAEGIARQRLAQRLQVAPERIAEFGFELRSMGVYAGASSPPSPLAVEVLRTRGIDISAHRSNAAVPEEIARLDRVYAMTRSHLDALRLMLPPGADQHCALLDPQDEDIPDPIGGPKAEYESTAQTIERAIAARLDEWA
jgi:tRNA threonylcarbamoyl adenosine modification protein (Sua5/YciO/YrdC/YwlC family)